MRDNTIEMACSIYCNSTLLTSIQLSGIFNDSKTFVDMPMLYDPDVILKAFDNALSTAAANGSSTLSNEKLLEFVNENFSPAGSDFKEWIPPDWIKDPLVLNELVNSNKIPPKYVSWASDLNQLWLQIGRVVTDDVKINPQRHSFIPMEYGTIVPGGRFRESYYWDSYFIIKGLLTCDMYQTSLNIIRNLLNDINSFEYVPNGGRVYYLGRSQPPMLSAMIVTFKKYIDQAANHNHNISSNIDGHGLTLNEFLSTAYPLLKREYAWWMNDSTGHSVNITQKNQTFTLNRYFSENILPRPESFLEDFNSARPLKQCAASSDNVNNSEDYAPSCKQFFYQNIRAGAESGWDFSSRWGAQKNSTTSISTNQIIPVDLNSIMFNQEQNLAYFADYLGNNKESEFYENAAKKRQNAMFSVLYSESNKQFYDYNLTSNPSQNTNTRVHADVDVDLGEGVVVDGSLKEKEVVSISSYLPLWAGLITNDTIISHNITIRDILTNLKSSQLLGDGGVCTTGPGPGHMSDTGQQWDYPNAWAPLVYFTIEGLNKISTINLTIGNTGIGSGSGSNDIIDSQIEAANLAKSVTSKWLESNYLAYNSSGSGSGNFMYEKYDCRKIGHGGGGGEYVPQVGFGWTNAVALYLLQQSMKGSSNSPTLSPTVPDNNTNKMNSNSLTNGFNTEAIIAIVSVSFVIILILIYFLLMFWKHRNKSSNNSDGNRDVDSERVSDKVGLLKKSYI
jgi:alpha,alpha-trehalase